MDLNDLWGLSKDASTEPPTQVDLIRAQQLLSEATHLLVATGAGFSADSGLPVYADVASSPAYQGLTYADLCRPALLMEDPALFYGFWGDSLNKYRGTQPHEGYARLQRWLARVGWERCYIYSSNVDGHVRRYLPSFPVYEIHGSIERWVCSRAECPGASDPKTPPLEPYLFVVNGEMRAVAEADQGPSPVADNGFIWRRNSPSCFCGAALRPQILMFGEDGGMHDLCRSVDDGEARYNDWIHGVEAAMKADADVRLVILEFGCGIRVPSLRLECEDVLRDAMKLERRGCSQVHLIRVNPEYPLNKRCPGRTVSICASSLDAILRIDALSQQPDSQYP